MPVEIIQKYFPKLSPKQIDQFAALEDLYADWNSQINVISRKDMDQFYERHVLHSLAIAQVIRFAPGSAILDVGTGGGFPGIPLAIMFPESNFLLIDSIGKKIKVVEAVANSLGLSNVEGRHCRAEEVKDQFDFVTSRAVAQLSKFVPWIRNNIDPEMRNGMPNGLLALKGGDLDEEISKIEHHVDVFEIKDYFKEEFFETKKVVYVSMS